MHDAGIFLEASSAARRGGCRARSPARRRCGRGRPASCARPTSLVSRRRSASIRSSSSLVRAARAGAGDRLDLDDRLAAFARDADRGFGRAPNSDAIGASTRRTCRGCGRARGRRANADSGSAHGALNVRDGDDLVDVAGEDMLLQLRDRGGEASSSRSTDTSTGVPARWLERRERPTRGTARSRSRSIGRELGSPLLAPRSRRAEGRADQAGRQPRLGDDRAIRRARR